MDVTLLIGIAVVALGTALGAIMMFGQRTNSLAENAGANGTIPLASATTSQHLSAPSVRRELHQSARPPVPPGLRSDDVRIRWYQRLRALLGLVVLVVGIGMALGATLGLGALAISLFLG